MKIYFSQYLAMVILLHKCPLIWLLYLWISHGSQNHYARKVPHGRIPVCGHNHSRDGHDRTQNVHGHSWSGHGSRSRSGVPHIQHCDARSFHGRSFHAHQIFLYLQVHSLHWRRDQRRLGKKMTQCTNKFCFNPPLLRFTTSKRRSRADLRPAIVFGRLKQSPSKPCRPVFRPLQCQISSWLTHPNAWGSNEYLVDCEQHESHPGFILAFELRQ